MHKKILAIKKEITKTARYFYEIIPVKSLLEESLQKKGNMKLY